MRILIIFTAVALALPTMSIQAQEPDSQALPTVDLPPEVERVLRDYERAWQARDEKALVSLFTEDGFALRPGQPPVRGRDALLRTYENAGGSLALRALDYALSGDVGFVIGGYSAEPGEPDVGKFVLPLRRGTSGRWLIAADIDNGNRR